MQQKMFENNTRLFWLAIFVILVLSTALRFYRLSDPYVWTDEAFSVLLSRNAPAAIWLYSAHDVHPPLYYELLRFWTMLWGESPFAIRSLSAVMGVAAVGLGIWLTRAMASRCTALLAGLMLSLLPISVRYSQEARMYTLMALLLIGATIALLYWVRQPGRQRFLLLYVALISASFYTHYFTAMCVLAHWSYLGVLALRSASRPSPLQHIAWWLANVAIVVVYLPWLYTLWNVLDRLAVSSLTPSVSWIEEMSLATLPRPFWRTLIATRGDALPTLLFASPVVALFMLAIRLALKDRSPQQLPTLMFAYTFLPVLVTFLTSLVLPMFVERYVLFALMGLPIVLALLLENLQSKALKWGGLLLVVSLEICGLHTDFSQHEDLDGTRNSREYPFEEVAAYLARSSLPGDRMVVVGGFWFFSVIYYNRSPILPQLNEKPGSGFGASTVLKRSASQVFLSDLATVPEGNCRIWWVGALSESGSVPAYWRLLSERTMGSLGVRLFQTGPNPAGTDCPPAPTSNDATLWHRD